MNVFTYLVPVALAAVAVVLVMGVLNMMRGGSSNRSQKLMRMRVLLQFGAIVVLLGALYFAQK
jgi:NADH:ubiquinone oxidoreductase subunit H